MSPIWESLVNLVPGIIIAILTAWVTVVLAMKRFRTERWWDSRANAYHMIIEALHVMKQVAEDELQSIEENRPAPNEEDRKELAPGLRQARGELRKAVDSQSFVLCKEATTALEELMRDFQKARDESWNKAAYQYNFYEMLGGELEAIDRCLGKLLLIAKSDLKVK
jgi:hypothetical protein